jgi:hypothetical protein
MSIILGYKLLSIDNRLEVYPDPVPPLIDEVMTIACILLHAYINFLTWFYIYSRLLLNEYVALVKNAHDPYF